MRKSTWVALSIFVLLWVAAAWVVSRKPERGMSRISFATIDANDVARIEVSGPHAVQLKKDGPVWRLPNGRLADGDAVGSLLSRTQSIQSSDKITQDSGRFAEFAVDSEHGTAVKLYGDGGRVADFTVGMASGKWTAVRVDNSVYKVSGALQPTFARDANAWVERRLFLGAPDHATKLTVALAGEAPYSLLSKDGTWQLLDEDASHSHDFRLDPAQAQSLFYALAHSRAETFVDQDPGIEVTKLGAQAESLTWFTREDADNGSAQDANAAKQVSRTLLLGASVDGSQRYAQVEGSREICKLSGPTVSALRRQLVDLRDLGMMASFDTAQVRSLAISDGKERLIFSRDANTNLWHTASKMPANFVLDSGKVSARIAGIARARAQMVAKDASRERLVPKGSVQLTFDDRKVHALTFYGSAESDPPQFFARGTADSALYGVTPALRDTLLAGLLSFRREQQTDPLSQIDPQALKSLPPEIRAGLEKQMAQKARQQQAMQLMRQARQP